MSPEIETQVWCALAVFTTFYIGGIGHGIILGWTWERRMRRWADTVVKQREEEN